jgi:putative RNA 2'-phosphotransferase
MPKLRSPKKLAKFITYALGHKPDEFGLLLEKDGFVKIKEFLKVICEEDGLKYVRRSHIDEILFTLTNPPIEIKDNFIRAKNRDNLPRHEPADDLPKHLYTSVRRKAYPVVLEKGIFPAGFSRVVLSSDLAMAERIGKRKDSKPVLLTIQAHKSMQKGVLFYSAGAGLFLAESIPPGCFTGPPLPQQKHIALKKEAITEKPSQYLPGSFIVELKDKNDHRKASKHRRNSQKISKGKGQRRDIKKKHKRERPPWRS